MKAIKIDVEKQKVHEVDFDHGLGCKAIASQIGGTCQVVECIALENEFKKNPKKGCENDLWIDEEFLLTLESGDNGFIIDGFEQTPLFGNGLVCGVNIKTGDTIATSLTVEEIEPHIKFIKYVETDISPEGNFIFVLEKFNDLSSK